MCVVCVHVCVCVYRRECFVREMNLMIITSAPKCLHSNAIFNNSNCTVIVYIQTTNNTVNNIYNFNQYS